VGQQIGAASVVRTTACRRRRCHRGKCASLPPRHAFGAKLKPYLLSLKTTADDFASILSACITSMRCHCACLARCELVNAMIVRRSLEQTHIEFVTFTVRRAFTADTMLTTRDNVCITLRIAHLPLQVATVAALGPNVKP
jgi:Na+-translocating ferredoxin:NAD+ oxidoreductase RnfC subunit